MPIAVVNRATFNPTASGWPDATNTGVPAGTSLTPHSGNFDTTSDGETVDALDVTDGAIVVNHDNVLIKRCRVSSDSFTPLFIATTAGGTLTIEDCELDAQNVAGSSGIHYDGPNGAPPSVTVRRVNIHGVENGVGIGYSNFDMQDCYLHDLVPLGPDPHTDGLQCSANTTNVTIVHNNFDMRDNGPANSAIQFNTTDLTNEDWLIENNKLLASPTQGGVTIRMPLSDASANNLRIRNNRITAGNFGYSTPVPHTVTEWSGNVDDVTGDPVTGT